MPNTVICTVETCDTFVHFFRSKNSPQVALPIYIYTRTGQQSPFIYFNTEQLTRTKELSDVVAAIQQSKPAEVWDYSRVNVELLKSHGIDAKHVPICSEEGYLSKLRSWRTEILYDVGFCGSPSPRRNKIIDELKATTLRILFLCKESGDARDRELAKCKVLINIHYADDYKLFEVARCEPWLAMGVPVITEHSLDNDDRCINVDYNDLVKTVIEMCAVKNLIAVCDLK
jgi:hypothetical protein